MAFSDVQYVTKASAVQLSNATLVRHIVYKICQVQNTIYDIESNEYENKSVNSYAYVPAYVPATIPTCFSRRRHNECSKFNGEGLQGQ